MDIVQLTLTEPSYASALRDLLLRGGVREVRCIAMPDLELDGVIVVDPDALDLLPFPLPNPERIVLITSNDPQHLSSAWNAGVRSVVFSQDPLATAVLAIMAAELRAPRADHHCAGAHAALPVVPDQVRKGG
jgi:hypothetical protein